MELVRLIVIAYITEAIEQRIPNPFQDSHINPCQHAERLSWNGVAPVPQSV